VLEEHPNQIPDENRKIKTNLSVQRKYWIALIMFFWEVPKQNPKITAKH